MTAVVVNNGDETFTPTQSGAIATVIWETCRAGLAAGRRPVVVSRQAAVAPFPWEPAIWVPQEPPPRSEATRKAGRLVDELTGWPQAGRRRYARRVRQGLARQGVEPSSLLLHNDARAAPSLARHHRSARVGHVFHNQLEVSPRLAAGLARAGVRVAAVSRFTADWLRSSTGLAEVAVVRNGVDLEAFHPAPEPDGPTTVGFVGRTGIEKAPDLLLRAALLLAGAGHELAVQVVGSNHWDRFELDGYQRELRGLADQLAARGVPVTWAGHVGRAELPAWIHRSHVHVTTSRWDEPFGQVTLEAMACGRPVVASATGGTPEVVGDAGLTFPRDDAEALAARLAPLLADAAARRELGRAARQRAEGFSWASTEQAYAELVAP